MRYVVKDLSEIATEFERRASEEEKIAANKRETKTAQSIASARAGAYNDAAQLIRSTEVSK